jgi:hypothetical protein
LEDVTFLLDPELRFVECNAAWDDFALANGGAGILRNQIQGHSILRYIPYVLRTFYVNRYRATISTRRTSNFVYDCSTPEKIRIFRMTIEAVPAGLFVTSHLELVEDCTPCGPLTPERTLEYISSTGFATMCANCRKTRRLHDSGVWDWVPDMILHDQSVISHGLCPRCASHLYGEVEGAKPV